MSKSKFNKGKLLVFALSLPLVLAACSSPSSDGTSSSSSSGETSSSSNSESSGVAGTYTSTYTNGMGSEETAQIVLGEDASAQLSFPGDAILGADLYTGTYTYTIENEVTTVSIVGLKDENNSVSPYPALWSGWIDSSTGNCQITLNDDGTFNRVLTGEEETYVSGLYEYVADGITYQVELSLDGSCGFKEGDASWVEGTYSMDATTVTITLINYTGSCSFVKDGVMTIVINADYTFTPKATSTTYTYAEEIYIEMIGQTVTETSILVLNDDLTCSLKKDGSMMLTDTYYGTYILADSVVTVSGLATESGEVIPGAEETIGFSYVTDGSFVATLNEDGTFVPVSSDVDVDVSGTYTYTYDNPYGISETMQIVLDAEGGIVLSMPGHQFITDSYTGTYVIKNSVTIAVTFETMSDLLASNFTLENGKYVATIILSGETFSFSSGDSGDDTGSTWEGGESYESLAYGEGDNQNMSLYVPESDEALPLFVTIHGGMFLFGDASMMSDVYEFFRDQGYVVASLNYTTGAATYPQAVIDCKTAVQYLVDNAAAYNIDVNNIIVMGESAGSTIASLVALSSNSDYKVAGQSADYSFAATTYVDFYGPVSNGDSALSSDDIDSGVTNWLGEASAPSLSDYLADTTCKRLHSTRQC